MITLGEAQQSRALRIGGVVPTSPDFIQLVNDATRELLKRGNWYGTLQHCRTCVWNNLVTWNRYVGTVLAVDVCGVPTDVYNLWYDWQPPGSLEWNDRWNHFKTHACGALKTVNSGFSPVFNQPNFNEPVFLQFYPTSTLDYGQSITVYGIDAATGQPNLTRRSDGTIQPGETISLTPQPAGLGYVTSTLMYRRIDRISKPVTQGRINCFLFDPVLSIQVPMAVYEPTETSPMYQQSRVSGFPGNCCQRTVSALVKIEFVEVAKPDDMVQVDNLDALALAMQSIKASDAYDSAGAEVLMNRAVKNLNLQLKDKFPVEQTPVFFRPFGTAVLQRVKISMR